MLMNLENRYTISTHHHRPHRQHSKQFGSDRSNRISHVAASPITNPMSWGHPNRKQQRMLTWLCTAKRQWNEMMRYHNLLRFCASWNCVFAFVFNGKSLIISIAHTHTHNRFISRTLWNRAMRVEVATHQDIVGKIWCAFVYWSRCRWWTSHGNWWPCRCSNCMHLPLSLLILWSIQLFYTYIYGLVGLI